MSGKSFLDTNIFVYNFDSAAPEKKRRIARQLIRDALAHRRSVISYQVVQEFLNIATRKFANRISIPDAQQLIQVLFKPLLAVHASPELFSAALDVSGRYQLSWYDSLIVAAAAETGCAVLYSEDLQSGAKIGGVRFENPFSAASS